MACGTGWAEEGGWGCGLAEGSLFSLSDFYSVSWGASSQFMRRGALAPQVRLGAWALVEQQVELPVATGK